MVKLEQKLTKKELKEFLKSDFVQLKQYHFSIGLWIRNNLLSDEIFMLLQKAGLPDADEMSQFIIELFYVKKRLSNTRKNKN